MIAGYSAKGAVKSPMGCSILLIGSALAQSAAHTCLGADVSLHTSRTAAHALAQDDPVACYNKAVEQYASLVADACDGSLALAPLGLSSNGLHSLCKGAIPCKRCDARRSLLI